MSFTYEQLQSLSAVELKEILHKKHIDSVGIFDSAILINLILGNHETQQSQPSLPQSYLKLFDVSTLSCIWLIGRKETKWKCSDENKGLPRSYRQRTKESGEETKANVQMLILFHI